MYQNNCGNGIWILSIQKNLRIPQNTNNGTMWVVTFPGISEVLDPGFVIKLSQIILACVCVDKPFSTLVLKSLPTPQSLTVS